MGWLFSENYSNQCLYPLTIDVGFRRPYTRFGMVRAFIYKLRGNWKSTMHYA